MLPLWVVPDVLVPEFESPPPTVIVVVVVVVPGTTVGDSED